MFGSSKWLWTMILLLGTAFWGCASERSPGGGGPTHNAPDANDIVPGDEEDSVLTEDTEIDPPPKEDTASTPVPDVTPFESMILETTISEVPTLELGATLVCQTTVSTEIEVRLTGPGQDRILPTSSTRTEEDGTMHSVLLIGMRPDSTYDVTVEITADAQSETVVLQWTTPPLPEDFPPILILHSDPEQMSPGITFFGVNTVLESGKTDPNAGLLLGLDLEGAVVWFHRAGTGVQGLQLLPHGHIMFVSGGKKLVEVGPRGKQVQVLMANAIGLDSLHHSFFPKPDGNLIALSTELQLIDGYPNEMTFAVVGDVLAEIDTDNEVVQTWSMFDTLDPYRILHGWETMFWNNTYPDAPGGAKDWTHGNGIVVDENDGGFLLSFRHQDLVLKMNPDTLELLWVVGEDHPATSGDDDWPFLTLVGEGRLPSQQHSPSLLPNDHLLVYDNGTKFSESRAVKYALDLEAMKITQVWEFMDPDYDPPLFSRTAGSAAALPGGTILIADAALTNPLATNPKHTYGRITEVTEESPPVKVFEVALRDPDVLMDQHYRTFAAIRISDVYDLIAPSD